jgi:hypothetical protein
MIRLCTQPSEFPYFFIMAGPGGVVNDRPTPITVWCETGTVKNDARLRNEVVYFLSAEEAPGTSATIESGACWF